MTAGSSEYDHVARWREWKAHNVELDRRSALQIRILFGVVFIAVAARLAMQLLSA